MLNLEVQKLEITLAQRQQQIEKLTAEVKEQVAQIQKVNTQLETSKPSANVIANKLLKLFKTTKGN